MLEHVRTVFPRGYKAGRRVYFHQVTVRAVEEIYGAVYVAARQREVVGGRGADVRTVREGRVWRSWGWNGSHLGAGELD